MVRFTRSTPTLRWLLLFLGRQKNQKLDEETKKQIYCRRRITYTNRRLLRILYVYVVCGCEPESSGHILWDCEKAQEVWKLTGIPFDTHERIFPEFIDLL